MTVELVRDPHIISLFHLAHRCANVLRDVALLAHPDKPVTFALPSQCAARLPAHVASLPKQTAHLSAGR